MVASLRNRLSKKQPMADLNATADGTETERASSPEDMDLLTHRPKVPQSDDSNTPLLPPSPPGKSPHREKQRSMKTASPTQSLLDWYKLRSGGASSETSLTEPLVPRQSGQAGKTTAFNEDFTEGNPKQTVKLVDSSPASSPFADSPNETRTYRGVEFEMMNKKKVVVGRQGPSMSKTGDISPRRTRSKGKGHQRIDSLDAEVNVKDFATQNSDVPAPLRTASYSSDSGSRRTSGDYEAGDANISSATSAKSPRSSPTKLFSPSRFGRSSSASSTEQSPTTTSLIASLRPKPLNLSHHRRNSSSSSIPTTLVNPPKPGYNPTPAFLWTSVLPSTSRPTDAWAPTKRWVCCQCRRREPEREAAETIVEQRVCARLECGHERCYLGCEMAAESGSAGY